MDLAEYPAKYNHLKAELNGLPDNPPDDPLEVIDMLRWLMTASAELVGIIDTVHPPFNE
jgi:hypothetical protein